MPFSEDTLTRLKADAAEITGRYPRARSALLPLLYLVQAEEGYVSDEGMAFCAEVLGITQTEVRGVATFYTMYKHEPAAEYQVGVCTNTTCAIMGGDQIYAELAEHLGRRQPARTTATTTSSPRTARSPSSALSATRPATTPPW